MTLPKHLLFIRDQLAEELYPEHNNIASKYHDEESSAYAGFQEGFNACYKLMMDGEEMILEDIAKIKGDIA